MEEGGMQESSDCENDSPLFAGVFFLLAGFDPVTDAQLAEALERSGGTNVGRYGESCTHVIVSRSLPWEDSVCIAARKDEKALVTELWVADCLNQCTIVNVNSVIYKPLKNAAGISGSKNLVICLTGYQGQARWNVMRMVQMMGAVFSKPLIANRVTHLICYKFEGEKYRLAKQLGLKLVNHRWLEDCLEQWVMLPEEDYLISGYELELLEIEAKDSEDDAGTNLLQTDLKTTAEIDIACEEATNKVACQLEKEKDDVSRSPPHRAKDIEAPPLRTPVKFTLGIEYSSKISAEKCWVQKEGFREGCKNNQASSTGMEGFSVTPHLQSPCRDMFSNDDEAGIPKGRSVPGSLSGNHGCEDGEMLIEGKSASGSLGVNSSCVDVEIFQTNEVGHDAAFEVQEKNAGNVSTKECIFSEENADPVYKSYSPKERKLSVQGSSEVSCETGKGKRQNSNVDDGRECRLLEAIMGDGVNLLQDLGTEKTLPITSPDKPLLLEEKCSGKQKKGKKQWPKQRNAASESMDGTMLQTADETDIRHGSVHPGKQIGLKKERNQKGRQESARNDEGNDPSCIDGEMPQKSKVDVVDAYEFLVEEERPEIGSTKKHSLSGKKRGAANRLNSSKGNNKLRNSKALDEDQMQAGNISDGLNLVQDLGVKSTPAVPSSKKPVSSKENRKQFGLTNEEKPKAVCDGVPELQKVRLHSPSKHYSKVGMIVSGHDTPSSRLPKGGEAIQAEDAQVKKKSPRKGGEHDGNKEQPNAALFKNDHCQDVKLLDKDPTCAIVSKDKQRRGTQSLACQQDGHPEKQSKQVAKQGQQTDHSEKPKVKRQDTVKKNNARGRPKSKHTDAEYDAQMGKENAAVMEGGQNPKQLPKSADELLVVSNGDELADCTNGVLERRSSIKCFAFSGPRDKKRPLQLIAKRLGARLSRDTHQWSYQTTHLIIAGPLRRTEKFFAAAAAGRWILRGDYLLDCNAAGTFLDEKKYEWYGLGMSEDGSIGLESPRKWRELRESTGICALEGLCVLIYGECIIPSLETLKRATRAGGGTMLAVSPPYTRFLASGVDIAIVSPGTPKDDYWVQSFLNKGVACVTTDFLVDLVCKPGSSLERHVLYDSHAPVDKIVKRLHQQTIPIKGHDIGESNAGVDDHDVACSVCGKADRDDVLLLCGDDKGSGCGIAMHMDCCNPALEQVPAKDWYCAKCKKSQPPRSSRKKKRKVL